MLKAAIVGCGAISKLHAEALKLIENTKITAFCDSIFERAQKKAEEYGGKPYSSLEQMLENENIDVLHICTPHYLHVPMAKKALSKNINVLMEKPPAISYDQYEELYRATNEQVRLGICFQNRYNDSVVTTKKYLESGKFGKVLGARAIVTWARNESYYKLSGWRGEIDKEGGGVLINQSIHTLDLITYLLGTPKTVTAQTANFHLKGIINEEDTVTAFIEYSDKTAMFFATTANCKDAPIILEIVCENATLRIEGNTLRVTTPDKKSDFFDFTPKSVNGKSCWGGSHSKLIADFYNCLKSGENFPVTLESTRPSFDTMMTIYDSAKCGKQLNIGEKI